VDEHARSADSEQALGEPPRQGLTRRRVVIGENTTFLGAEDLLRDHGVQVVVADSPECRELMARFITAHPGIWNEDIGEPPATA
jgi:hypothetical protein